MDFQACFAVFGLCRLEGVFDRRVENPLEFDGAGVEVGEKSVFAFKLLDQCLALFGWGWCPPPLPHMW